MSKTDGVRMSELASSENHRVGGGTVLLKESSTRRHATAPRMAVSYIGK